MKKYLSALIITLAFLFLPSISLKAENVEEDGFVYFDGLKRIVCEIPNVETLVIPEGVRNLSCNAYVIWGEEGEIDDYVGGEKTIFDKVKYIYLPSSMTEISEYYLDPEVFPNLQEIHIAEGNKSFSIKDGVLYSLTPLAQGKEYSVIRAFPNLAKGDIMMPSTVVYTEYRAFDGCDKIDTLTFSRDFAYMDYDVQYDAYPDKNIFGECKNIKEFYVEEGNKNYMSQNGCLYSADGAELYMVPTGYEGKLTIPKGTMRIHRYALKDCTKITEIKIPYGVTDWCNFENCDSLKKVVIPSSVEFGVYFENCDNLEVIKFKWKKVPEDVSRKIVKKCPNLKNIYVPKGTKKHYKNNLMRDVKGLIKEGNYKPQKKNIKRLQKPKVTLTVNLSLEKIDIEWEQVLYATKYNVQMKVNGKWKTIKDFWNYNDIRRSNPRRVTGHHLIQGDELVSLDAEKLKMKDGEIYFFRVVGYRGSIKSVSEPQKVGHISKPKAPSVMQKKDGTVIVKWKKKNVTGYKIKVYNTEDGSSRYFTVKGAAKTKKTIKGLKKGVRYRIYLSAYCKSGKQEWTSKQSKSAKVVVK